MQALLGLNSDGPRLFCPFGEAKRRPLRRLLWDNCVVRRDARCCESTRCAHARTHASALALRGRRACAGRDDSNVIDLSDLRFRCSYDRSKKTSI
eukprot:6196845-Pleurochrysis_carterae.AAC.2